jgi:hypothetical protein
MAIDDYQIIYEDKFKGNGEDMQLEVGHTDKEVLITISGTTAFDKDKGKASICLNLKDSMFLSQQLERIVFNLILSRVNWLSRVVG